ncbi:DUF4255 domain-containing protein [Anaeromicropila populeti]|uniref:Pvc16 N-terminal domain-containing protein n=1 Tax=Anaeromicropila populeti TaxID=37658 RepID=A0A1I6LU21_9FIRM|nr:DUF4255 domain-containing protein [Anaeromicropila populeti]SFS06896.1 Protein of unknown function [Anaeromicropila populeti]
MGSYSIISEIDQGIIKLLRDNMVPDLISSPDKIGLCSPSEKGDISLGIYLYDIKESDEVFERGMSMSGRSEQKAPSKFINLYYMFTAYSTSDLKFRALEEHRILGKIIQVFADNPMLGEEYFPANNQNFKYPLKVEMNRTHNETESKIWNGTDMPNKLSLYFKIYPVEIESTRVKKVQRVVDVDFKVDEAKS